MQPRLPNPAYTVPGAMQHVQALNALVKKGLPTKTALLVDLRASQINGCAFCADMHAYELKLHGESDERIWSVATWREAPYYTDAERAALALAEAATRINDRADAVSDEVWNEARKHYDDAALSALVLDIAMINFWNRINVTIRQPAGEQAHAAAKMQASRTAAAA